MNEIRTFGIVVLDSPLSPTPFKVRLFGKPDAPQELVFVDVREVDAMLNAIEPAVRTLCEYASGTDSERVQAAIANLKALFTPEVMPVAKPALVTA